MWSELLMLFWESSKGISALLFSDWKISFDKWIKTLEKMKDLLYVLVTAVCFL